MKAPVVAIIACVLFNTGCTFGVVTKNDPSNVKMGMSRDQVIQLMGKPLSLTATNNTEILRYNVSHSKAMPIAAGWQEYSFHFEDGKLISYGTK